MIAIIPAAGLGTRMSAVTGGAPKELLPLGRRSVLRRVVDEALAADPDEIVIVSSPNKPQIEAEATLWAVPKLRVAYQAEPKGLADALFGVPIEDDVLILLGDCVYQGASPAERMSTLVYRGVDGCIAVETVPDEETRRYGICEIDEMGGIRAIVEKPAPEDTASRWAVAARYAFSGQAWGYLGGLFQRAQAAETEEINFTRLLSQAIGAGMDIKAVALQPDQARVDCGTPEEYRAAMRLRWD